MIGPFSHHTTRFYLSVLLLLSPGSLLPQTPRGVITQNKEAVQDGKTRALIVGISKYEFITPLQFADRDAMVFADYLRRSRFWNMGEEDVTLLTNDQAKNGDLITQLARLARVSQPGDRLLFYFSGHGDVETITQFNNGYLLAYDTYTNNYIAGALPINFLKELIVTLLNKDVKVILITDACKSGKLAGGMKGAEYVASAIGNMWNNEIKILSTQPGHLSYEAEKWGNGRGVFSYYLIKGLNGDADANRDSSITLAELDQYVGSNVARETANDQQPIVEGPNKFSTVIARVSGNKEAPALKKSPGNSITPLHRRIQWPADSCNYYYTEMNRAIKEEKLSSVDRNAAAAWYKKLKHCSKDSSLVLQANSELLAGLMNSAQEIINNSFIGKNLVTERKFAEGIDLLDQALQYNDLHLPYESHLKNLKRYLKVQGATLWKNRVDTKQLDAIIDSAMQEETDAAYLLTAKATVEMEKANWGNAIGFLEKALSKSPGWLMPKYYLGYCYSYNNSHQKALAYYQEVLEKDTLYRTFECTKCILNRMAGFAAELNQNQKAVAYYLLSIDLFPDYYPAYESLYKYAVSKQDSSAARELAMRIGRTNTPINLLLLQELFGQAFFRKSIEPNPEGLPGISLKNRADSAGYYFSLGSYYSRKSTRDRELAYSFLSRALELYPSRFSYLLPFIQFLSGQYMHDEIVDVLPEKLISFSGDEKAQLQQLLAESYLQTENYKDAFETCKDLHEHGYLYCSDLKKYARLFKDLPAYTSYMKNCQDTQKNKLR